MKIKFKNIEKYDLELLRNWRMKESVTKFLLTDPEISKEQQIEWFKNISNDNTRYDYIIVCDDVKIGYYGITNINYNNKSCEVGFYIGEDEYRGKGLFKKINSYAENIIFNNLKLEKIYMRVLIDNPILNKYIDLGFEEDIEQRKMYHKNGKEHMMIYLFKQASKQV